MGPERSHQSSPRCSNCASSSGSTRGRAALVRWLPTGRHRFLEGRAAEHARNEIREMRVLRQKFARGEEVDSKHADIQIGGGKPLADKMTRWFKRFVENSDRLL